MLDTDKHADYDELTSHTLYILNWIDNRGGVKLT